MSATPHSGTPRAAAAKPAKTTRPAGAPAGDKVAGPPRRNLLLILGMHRSGTSALTGVLEKLGVELGEELLPPTRDNPKGYFENARVVAVQETLFTSLYRTWQDPRPLPAGWRESAVVDEAKEALTALVRDMFTGDTAVAAVKDPRTSRVVPLWLDVARGAKAQPGALLMLRHPGEVAGSLNKRDGLSRSRAHLLWMSYLLEAERTSRHIPRAFVSYEALLADWRGEIERIRQGLADAVPPATVAAARDIDDFLDVSLRSHKAADAVERVSPFESLAMELYGLALRCAAAPLDTRADAEFDAIAQKLERVAARYLEAPLQREEELQRQELDQSRIDMSMQLAALRELWRPAFPSRAPGSCRLYYRQEGAQFVETNAVSADPELLENGRQVTFELPADAKVDYLRMDPDDAPGVFAIQSLVIDGKSVEDLADRVGAVSELALPVTRTQDAVRFAALGEDPHFELDARGLAQLKGVDGPLHIRIRFRVETVLSEVGGYLNDFRLELQASDRQLRERQSRLAECAEALQRQLTTFAASAADISANLGALDKGSQAQREEIVRMRESIQGVGQSVACSTASTDEQLRAGFAELREALQAVQVRGDALVNEFAAIRDQQALLLGWAQRRSPGYWWKRMLGGNDDKKKSG